MTLLFQAISPQANKFCVCSHFGSLRSPPLEHTPVSYRIYRNNVTLASNLTDLNQDCYINLKDFAFVATNWLKCNDPEDPTCPYRP